MHHAYTARNAHRTPCAFYAFHMPSTRNASHVYYVYRTSKTHLDIYTYRLYNTYRVYFTLKAHVAFDAFYTYYTHGMYQTLYAH